MTAIAILGSGRVAESLARGLASAGHQLVIGTRDPERARPLWKGPDAVFLTPEDAIVSSRVVFNATPGDTSVERLGVMADRLAGKLLVDVANAVGRDLHGRPAGLLYADDSLAERLQAALPQTRVVKALNTMLAPVMSSPGLLSVTPTAFLSGDDADAKSEVRALLEDIGWPQEVIIDLGGIRTARGPEAVMVMVSDVVKAIGFSSFAFSIVR